MNVDRRRQPYAAVVLLHLKRSRSSDTLQKLLIPCARQHRRARPCRRRDAGFLRHAEACAAVRRHRVRHAPFFQIPPAIGIRNTGIRLAAGQRDQLIHRQLIHKFVQRVSAIRNRIEQNPLRMLFGLRRPGRLPLGHRLPRRERKIVHQIRNRLQAGHPLRIFSRLKRFKASVRKHSLRKLFRRAALCKLLQNQILLQGPGIQDPCQVPDAVARVEFIISLFQHPCRPAHLARIVIGGKAPHRK